MESSRRDLFIDMVVDRFILKNNYKLRSPPVSSSYHNQAKDYLKHGLVFTVQAMRLCDHDVLINLYQNRLVSSCPASLALRSTPEDTKIPS